MWKNSIVHFSILRKKKDKLHFTTINYTLDYILYPKFWISIQVNGKLDVGVQSVTNVIV